MKNFIKKITDLHKSVLLSVAFHVVLLVLFLLMHSGLDLPDTEFAEIGFVSASSTRAYRPATQKAAPAKAQPAAQMQESAPPPAPKIEAKAPPVNIPKRRMLEDEQPQLTKRTPGKLSPTVDVAKPTPREDVYDAESMRKLMAERSASGKDFASPGGESPDGRDAATPTGEPAAASGMPYTIEGDAAKRSIVNQVLPEYPPGLQNEAVVKIRFWVLPDGRIGNMLPLRKGDPVLDQLTIRAMRQWRFNAISNDAEKKNAEGVITFVYKLK